MKKCGKCKSSGKAPDVSNEQKTDEAQLWLEMMNSMVHFTETSTVLVQSMQNKLGVSPVAQGSEKKQCDPCALLEKLKSQLAELNVGQKPPTACKCTSPTAVADKSCASDDITPGIDYYKQPKMVKKKKYKYSPDIESKIIAQKKLGASSCQCEGEGGSQPVDTCLCENLPKEIAAKARCNEDRCPIVLCSPLEQSEIGNIKCVGKGAKGQARAETPVETAEPSKSQEKKEDDPLAWILKPGTYDPDKLPQDETHPFILKAEDDFKVPNNGLGFELFVAMKKFGNTVALIDDATGDQYTYNELLKKCILVSINLKKELSEKDIVGLCTSNHKDRSIPYLAALFNGNRVVGFDRNTMKEELTNCFKNITPKIMFVCTNSLRHVKECMEKAQVNFKIVVFGDSGSHESFDSYLKGDDDQVESYQATKVGSLESTALMCFSSGVTKFPNAACLSHYGVLRQCMQLIEYENVLPISMHFAEINHISCVQILFCSILAGATRVIVETFEAANIWNLVWKYKVRSMFLHPHQCVELSFHEEPEEDLSFLFCIFTGGERLNVKVLARLKELLLGTMICQTYGHTEMCGASAVFRLSRPEDHVLMYFKPECCGKPIDGVMYKIIGLETGKMLDHSSIGEVHIKSRMLRNGYYVNNKEVPCDKQGWFQTGDLASYDPYGCFHLAGRVSHLIRYRKKIIIPFKLEEILLSHPAVDVAVVVGIPNEEDGEHPMGLVKLKEKDDVYAKDLVEFVNKQVSEEEKLRAGLKIIEFIPFTSNGKIRRATLLNQVLSKEI